jgi:7-alpha-hydroxysteroid dehydrogenase
MLGLAHYFAKQVRINNVLIGTVLTEGYAAPGSTRRRSMR